MQLGGKCKKVRLNVDLTKYHPNAKKGSIGYTIPGTKLSMWGSQDRFVAVRFDGGGELDVLWEGLDIMESTKEGQNVTRNNE